MSTEVTKLTPEQQEKYNAWGSLGVAAATEQTAIEITAQQIASTLIAPTDVKQIPDAENTLKAAKSNLTSLIDRRKQLQRPVDEWITRIMTPEKEVKTALDTYSSSLITLKQKDELAKKAKQDKLDEATRIITALQNYKTGRIAKIKTEFSDTAVALLKEALEANVPATGIDEWLAVRRKQIDTAQWQSKPPSIKPILHTMDEVKPLIATHAMYQLNDLLPDLDEAIDSVFSDYAVSINNKEAALEEAKKASDAAALAAEKEAAAKKAATALTAAVFPPTVSTGGKGLKKIMKVDVDAMDNESGARTIIAAAFGNWPQVTSHLRMKSWRNLSLGNLIVALEAIKAGDDKFAPEGLIWKEVQKL